MAFETYDATNDILFVDLSHEEGDFDSEYLGQ